MLHGLALNLASLIWCTVSSDTLVGYTCLTAKPQCQIVLKALICSKQRVISSVALSVSEDTCCPLSLWCLQCCCWHSAGCRMSWVCLQHHATVVTSMLLQYVAASFHLPSVSTANINTVQYPKPYNVQYQQSQLLWYPRCCFLSPTSWQPLFRATAVSSLMSLHFCQNTTTIISQN